MNEIKQAVCMSSMQRQGELPFSKKWSFCILYGELSPYVSIVTESMYMFCAAVVKVFRLIYLRASNAAGTSLLMTQCAGEDFLEYLRASTAFIRMEELSILLRRADSFESI